jgi:predicted regulator of Ras-like GTPase activity (Roadblock/LC7/MglB family)
VAEQQAELKAALDKLLEDPGVIGCAVVRRDGIHVMDSSKRPVNQEIFSAMSAMLMGAAETALAELGQNSVSRIIVETGGMTMVVAGASAEYLLVTLASDKAALDGLLPQLEAAAGKVRQIVG